MDKKPSKRLQNLLNEWFDITAEFSRLGYRQVLLIKMMSEISPEIGKLCREEEIDEKTLDLSKNAMKL